ncbi:MAG: hypothetical protein Q8M76_12250, partial [Spirochaetaceae bacterium]|nr:hypothetical protein [Spirochaetaceae bacterium]
SSPAAASGAGAVTAVVDDMRNGAATGSAILALKKKGKAGDVAVKAVDIVGADLRLFPDMLVCGISFADATGLVTLNKAAVAGKALEYECSVVIDLDGNGQTFYSLSLTWYKEPKASPFEASPAEDCATEVWKASSAGYSPVKAAVAASWSSPFLVFVLRDSKDLPLKRITDRSRFSVKAYYDDGNEGMEDVLDL